MLNVAICKICKFYNLIFFSLLLLLLTIVVSYPDKTVPLESTEEIAILEDDCVKNWALCALFPDRKISYHLEKPSIKIAVLDSGINDNISVLKGKVKDRYNTLSNSTLTNDQLGHGTMVASIISSSPNEYTISGVNPYAELYDVQVLNEMGIGEVSNIVKGIEWAIEKQVDIINISFGVSDADESLEQVIYKALSSNIVVVAAAGNTFGLTVEYPAKYEGVYSISAVDENLKLYSHSARGKIDYVFPGVNVPVINHHEELELQSGTSFATAYATGILSLILQNNNNLDDYLRCSSKKLEPVNKFGKGFIQIK